MASELANVCLNLFLLELGCYVINKDSVELLLFINLKSIFISSLHIKLGENCLITLH